MNRSKHTGRTCGLLAKSGLVAAFLAGTGAGMVAQNAHADGFVRCWGFNNYGQCNTPADLGPCSSIAGGYYHTIALRIDGGVRCWGNNNYGQCNTPADLGSCSSIAGGGYHTIALRNDGGVQDWGRNNFSQLNTPANLGACSSVAGGIYHTIALRIDGGIRCWGAGLTNTGSFPNYGQCNTPSDLDSCSIVAGGEGHTIALVAPPPIDTDGDGRPDSTDNCPTIANPTQADCNNDGIGDVCEIASGAPDFNQDTIPDTCQCATIPSLPYCCIGDINGDHSVDGADIGILLYNWGPCGSVCLADLNSDGSVNGGDIGLLLSGWGPCPN